MSEQYFIPTEWPEAKDDLVSFGALATASEWKRAAIVYAFTHGSGMGRTSRTAGNAAVFSFSKLASEHIYGLTHRDTVAYYHNRWAELVEGELAHDLKPGDRFENPNILWNPEKEDKEEKAYWANVREAISVLIQAKQDVESEERIPPVDIALMFQVLFTSEDVDWDAEAEKLVGNA